MPIGANVDVVNVDYCKSIISYVDISSGAEQDCAPAYYGAYQEDDQIEYIGRVNGFHYYDPSANTVLEFD